MFATWLAILLEWLLQLPGVYMVNDYLCYPTTGDFLVKCFRWVW